MMPRASEKRQDTIITKPTIAGAQFGEDIAMRDTHIRTYSNSIDITVRETLKPRVTQAAGWQE